MFVLLCVPTHQCIRVSSMPETVSGCRRFYVAVKHCGVLCTPLLVCRNARPQYTSVREHIIRKPYKPIIIFLCAMKKYATVNGKIIVGLTENIELRSNNGNK